MTNVRAALFNKIALILSFAGIVIAGTLTYTKMQNIIVPCGVGDGCQDVTNHASSEWMGIPVAAFGLGLYLVLAAISALRIVQGIPATRLFGIIGYGLAAAGAVVSIGLQVYSILEIHAYCTWCIGSAVIMVALFILHAMIFQAQAGLAPSEAAAMPRKKSDLPFLVAVSALGAIALVTSGYMAVNGGKAAPKFVASEADIPRLVPADANVLGPADAAITIVEFGDLCCGACHKAYALLKDIMKANEGKIRLVFRHFPLINMHKSTYRASVYAEYAAEQGKFWQFLDLVNATAPEEVDNPENLANMLIGLGMDAQAAGKAYEDQNSKAFDRVYRDFTLANDLGIRSTPTFFVVIPGEKPFSMQISDILRMFDSDPKYRKLLGKE
jgi:protein-disulfide isomerase